MLSYHYLCYQFTQQKNNYYFFFLEINFMINTPGFLLKEQNKVP